MRKAVKWNSPLYGVEGQGGGGGVSWFLGIHCFTKHVKVAFFRPPPRHVAASCPHRWGGESKQKEVRYLDIHEPPSNDSPQLDEAQFTSWVKQASQLVRTPRYETANGLTMDIRRHHSSPR